jgi:DNA-directed RNA polymerases I, II, and III subunit RPABC1
MESESSASAGVTKLWRIRKTVCQMLEDRGYAVAQQFMNETRAEFEGMWQNAQNEGAGRERFVILVGHLRDENNKILVYFPDENKRVGVKPIRMLCEKMSENKISHAILVVRQSLTPFAKQAMAETNAKLRIEVRNII